jgi:hypothetical protein
VARRPRSTGDNPIFGPQRLVSLSRSAVSPAHPAGLSIGDTYDLPNRRSVARLGLRKPGS